jgi:hypothetical protein
MANLPVSVWIGNAAAVMAGVWGAVTQRTREAGCSRQTVYEHAKRVEQLVAEDLQRGPRQEELLAENRRLREENQALWEPQAEVIEFPKTKQQQFTATACAMGFSLNQIGELLVLLMDGRPAPSRATLERWSQSCARRAGELLRELDGKCQGLVSVACLDEIFFHGKPVLVGVEPQSMAWILGQRADDRSAATWAAALAPWEKLEYVVTDGGSGLRSALKQRQKARSDSPSGLETGLDVFHVKKEALPVLHRLWQKTEKVWVEAEQADQELARCRQQGHRANRAAGRARAAWVKAERAFGKADRLDAAWRQVEAALELFRPDGQLNDRCWAESQITAVVPQLAGPEWAKVRRMLAEPDLLTFLDRMHRKLQEAVPNGALREALLRLYWLRRQRRAANASVCQGDPVAARYLIQKVICQRMDSEWGTAYSRVARVLNQTLRASSVVECMNSVLRMHQARHRMLSQPLLDLKRLYWNCRSFREGKRRHACPYQHLGLQLPTYDWWKLLQTPTEKSTQEVSTQRLAI